MKENILLSYPRSGNHLVRFFIELLSERPTNGCKGNQADVPIYKNIFREDIPFNITDNKNYIYYKYHTIPYLGNINKLIFIIRNPKEVLLRHNNFKINNGDFNGYFHNIDKYLEFDGEKILFYYEDILTEKKEFIEKLYLFLDIENPEKLKYVLENVDHLYNLSVGGTGRAWGGNISNGQLNFYYDSEKNTNRKQFDDYLKVKLKNENYKFLVDKYEIKMI